MKIGHVTHRTLLSDRDVRHGKRTPGLPQAGPGAAKHAGRTPGELRMRALYPAVHPAEDEIPGLSEEQLSLKIARHSPCSSCPCPGLRPPVGVEVSLDDSFLSDQMEIAYLSECQCGHDVPSHGADVSVLGRPEYQRRGRVAFRIDELLKVR